MNKNKLWKIALLLSVFTIIYNIIEGLVSVFFGLSDETLSLFGFGLDSFIEVLSGIGIFHMIIRIMNSDDENSDKFERNALMITGLSFYILAFGLIGSVLYNLIIGHKPESTFWGIIVSTISILTMILLVFFKIKVGKKLNSDAIIADANCTKTCVYLSIILFTSSIIYHLFKIGFIDLVGALGIAIFAIKEGKESFDKSKGKKCSCSND